ncbi:hypothetical protein [Novosphingobium ginsenosidimutans]|uniref:hypothetical protein n=1 Tax=Novosphingobium ginsenosidimutans TaxID=1176536 RepID=UPI001375C3A9|nr:hypothetical protein [Novosphingobium ginsenosidimutans]
MIAQRQLVRAIMPRPMRGGSAMQASTIASLRSVREAGWLARLELTFSYFQREERGNR